jgi:hypothetical protein
MADTPPTTLNAPEPKPTAPPEHLLGSFYLHTGKCVEWSPDGKDPNHVYNQGSVVRSKVDLAAAYPEKFSYLGQRPGTGTAPETPETLEAQIAELQKRAAGLKKEAASAPSAPTGEATNKPPVKALDDMTPAELTAFCEDEEIDLARFKPKHPGNPKLAHDEKVAFVKAQVGGK